jgi:septation ring formation regulator EzrA
LTVIVVVVVVVVVVVAVVFFAFVEVKPFVRLIAALENSQIQLFHCFAIGVSALLFALLL